MSVRNIPNEDTSAMKTAGHTVFQTKMGFAGFAWGHAGITRLCLPERSRTAVERRLSDHGAAVDSPRAQAAELVARIEAYFDGNTIDFSDVEVDLAGMEAFRRDIYAAARRLRFGEAVTYGELARRAGHEGLARETGVALGANPVPLVVPCHRIVAAGGRIGGFSAPGGSATKQKMLELEGVQIGPPPSAQQSFGF